MGHVTYLDNAASSPIRPEALEAALASMRDHAANPSAIHALGQAARLALEKARNEVAALADADASEVVFTSGATEANNLALRGAIVPRLEAGAPVHAVTTALEHPSVSRTFADLQRRGLQLTVVPPGADGAVRAEDVLAAVRPETALVSVVAASNELGAAQPVEAIGKALRKLPAPPLFHVDAVQAAVSSELTFREASADLFTLSAHKIGGPKGVGGLIVRRGVTLAPVLTGGSHEGGRRPGTENASGIAGFGAAAASLRAGRAGDIVRYRALRDRLLSKLPSGARPLLPPEAAAVPHILALECVGKENDWIVLLLSRAGVMVSAGSACSSGSREASAAVKALGLDDARARSVLRVSFGHANDEKDVDGFVDVLTAALAR